MPASSASLDLLGGSGSGETKGKLRVVGLQLAASRAGLLSIGVSPLGGDDSSSRHPEDGVAGALSAAWIWAAACAACCSSPRSLRAAARYLRPLAGSDMCLAWSGVLGCGVAAAEGGPASSSSVQRSRAEYRRCSGARKLSRPSLDARDLCTAGERPACPGAAAPRAGSVQIHVPKIARATVVGLAGFSPLSHFRPRLRRDPGAQLRARQPSLARGRLLETGALLGMGGRVVGVWRHLGAVHGGLALAHALEQLRPQHLHALTCAPISNKHASMNTLAATSRCAVCSGRQEVASARRRSICGGVMWRPAAVDQPRMCGAGEV